MASDEAFVFNAACQSVSYLKFQRDFDFEAEPFTVALPMDDGSIAFKAKVNESESPSLLKFSLHSKQLSIAKQEEALAKSLKVNTN